MTGFAVTPKPKCRGHTCMRICSAQQQQQQQQQQQMQMEQL
jgi:hypothetical protein